MMFVMAWESNPAWEEYGDPYWRLADVAPRLAHDVQDVIRNGLGVTPDAPESYDLDMATADAVEQRLQQGSLSVDDLGRIPPELAGIWGTHELIATSDVTISRQYPPQPVLRIRNASSSTRYRVEVVTYMAVGNSTFTQVQQHTATRTTILRNGQERVKSTQCLVGVQAHNGRQVAISTDEAARQRLVHVGTQSIEAWGMQSSAIYN